MFFLVLLLCMVPAGLVAQEGPARVRERAEAVRASIEASGTLSPRRRELALQALSLIGRTSLALGERSFPWDCSGTVLAALWLSGIDVRKAYALADGNGVRRLQTLAASQDLLYDLPLPQAGDLVFWDNTYDMNNDKTWNDELTHVGIVVWVGPDGTVDYVHHDYRRGITLGRMNLFVPAIQYAEAAGQEGTELNTPLRMKSHEYIRPGIKLSGQLFRNFGRLAEFVDGPDK